jgi:DNA helicase-2/ATP-dependent DNA helicase PcrA
VRRLAEADGLVDEVPDGVGDEEATRQADLGRLVRLAEEFEGSGSVADFLADLRARFAGEGDARGVNLLTFHRAKGLEFDAVLLPRLEEKELPARQARTEEAVQEERRLLYVGLTRARRHLVLSWAGRPSRFVTELELRVPRAAAARPVAVDPRTLPDGDLYAALAAWRRARADADEVPPYVVFTNRTLEEIVRRLPRSAAELLDVPGVGDVKLDRYGEELLATLTLALDRRAPTAGAPA